MKLEPHQSNARLVDGAGADDAPVGVGALVELGYAVWNVASLQVLFCDPFLPGADRPLEEQPVGKGGWDGVVSGTFRRLVPGPRGAVPAGTVVRDGRLDAQGGPETAGRGGVAVLEDGSILVGRAEGTGLVELEARFGQPGRPLRHFLGGGALLIEEDEPTDEIDLLVRQGWNGRAGGFRAPQMVADHHLVLGIKRGQCVIALSPVRAAVQIQADLLAAEFGAAVKFERGTGLFCWDGAIRFPGRNPSGLAFRLYRDG